MKTTSFIPVSRGTICESIGFNASGRRRFGEPAPMRFTLIRLDLSSQPTSIRTDKSGSKARANEEVLNGRVLIHPEVKVSNGCKVNIHDQDYEVVSTLPRYEMSGILNHYQADIKLWV